MSSIRLRYRETFFLRHFWSLTAFFLVVIICSYFWIDRPLALFFQHTTAPLQIVSIMLTNFIDPNFHYLIWPAIYFFVRFYWKKNIWANRILLILLSIPMVNLLAEVIKMGLGRARPELLFSQHLFGFEFFEFHNSELSFPSGHACTVAALLSSIACFYPRHTLLLSIAIFLLSFTRVILTFHYLSDILAGIWCGILVAQWCYAMMRQEHLQFKMHK